MSAQEHHDHAAPAASVLLLGLLGVTATVLGSTDLALDYIRPVVRTLVLVSGTVLLALAVLPPSGAVSMLRARLSDKSGAGDVRARRDDHARVGIGWLIVVPLIVLAVVRPSPLGANAVAARAVRVPHGSSAYPPVGSPVRGAVPMSMAEFYTRALRDRNQSLRDVPVRLVGFVSSSGRDGGYQLSRFVIFCCAADAEAIRVRVTGDHTPRHTNEWLQVEGTWVPRPVADDEAMGDDIPVLTVRSVRSVAKPSPPYEYTTTWAG